MKIPTYKIYENDVLVCTITYENSKWTVTGHEGQVLTSGGSIEDVWFWVAGYMAGE